MKDGKTVRCKHQHNGAGIGTHCPFIKCGHYRAVSQHRRSFCSVGHVVFSSLPTVSQGSRRGSVLAPAIVARSTERGHMRSEVDRDHFSEYICI